MAFNPGQTYTWLYIQTQTQSENDPSAKQKNFTMVWNLNSCDSQTGDEAEEGELGLLERRRLQAGAVCPGTRRHAWAEALKQIPAGQHRPRASQEHTWVSRPVCSVSHDKVYRPDKSHMLSLLVSDPQAPPGRTSLRVAPCPEPTTTSHHGLHQDLQVHLNLTACLGPFQHSKNHSPVHLFIFFFSAVAHQNGGLKNTNHAANHRNTQHHNQRHPSSAARPFLPSNISQVKERGSSRPQPNLDCLKVPEQGAAGWETGNPHRTRRSRQNKTHRKKKKNMCQDKKGLLHGWVILGPMETVSVLHTAASVYHISVRAILWQPFLFISVWLTVRCCDSPPSRTKHCYSFIMAQLLWELCPVSQHQLRLSSLMLHTHTARSSGKKSPSVTLKTDNVKCVLLVIKRRSVTSSCVSIGAKSDLLDRWCLEFNTKTYTWWCDLTVDSVIFPSDQTQFSVQRFNSYISSCISVKSNQVLVIVFKPNTAQRCRSVSGSVQV